MTSTNLPGESQIDFNTLANNWINLPQDKIDDCFNQFLRDPRTDHMYWYRITNLYIEDIENFKSQFEPVKDLKNIALRVWLGVQTDKDSNPIFSPFVQISDDSVGKYQIIEKDCFRLIEVNELIPERIKNIKELSTKTNADPNKLHSYKIPVKLKADFKKNWKQSSPAMMSDHFKVILDKNSKCINELPKLLQEEFQDIEFTLLSRVRYFNYNNLEGLKNKIHEISEIGIVLGLNLNLSQEAVPTFSPILQISYTNSSLLNDEEKYYEDLADPSPPF